MSFHFLSLTKSFLICSNSLTTVLNNIKERKHDLTVCYTNCKENGKIFNQIPHRCKFYPDSPKYEDLLEHLEIPNVDASDGGTSSNPNIKEFCLQLILLEDFKEEFSLGFRKEEDIIEVENAIENL